VPTVLVADDSSNIQKIVTLALQEEGFDVVAVGNGEAAVRKLPDVQPDVIVADIYMPARTGFEVCEFVSNDERFAYIPVILLAGEHDFVEDKDVQRAKHFGFLKKPTDLVPPGPLVAKVKEAATLSEQQRPPWVKRPERPKPKPIAAPGEAPQVSTQRLSADEIARMVAEQSAAKAGGEATVMMSAEEVSQLLGEPVAPPEPPMDEFGSQPERVEIAAGDEPLAFGDLLGTGVEEREAPPGEPSSGFEGAAMAEAAEAEAAEEEKAAVEWGGIREESKQPTPDEPPIKVEFGESEPMELVTDEHISPQIDAPPLAELTSSPTEWMAAAQEAAGAATVTEPEPEEAAAPSAPSVEDFVIPGSAQPAPPVEEEAPSAVPFPPIPSGEEASAAPASDTQELSAEEIQAAAARQAPAPISEPEPAPVATTPAPAPPAAISLAVPQPADPAVVDAVVEKVLARLSPDVIERVVREVLRPLAEEITRRELEK
jgi:CheY-like chemotaxis protein